MLFKTSTAPISVVLSILLAFSLLMGTGVAFAEGDTRSETDQLIEDVSNNVVDNATSDEVLNTKDAKEDEAINEVEDANLSNVIESARNYQLQNAGDPTTEEAADRIFTYDTVVLRGMPVVDTSDSSINEEITFTFWNATMERFEGTAKSVNGVLEDKEVYKGHRYIAYCDSTKYNFACTCNNAYFILNETGNQPLNDRSSTAGAKLTSFKLKVRDDVVADAKEARRVAIENISLWFYDADLEDFDDNYDWETDAADLKIKFTNAYGDTQYSSAPDEYGNVSANLFEDMPYFVSCDSDVYDVISFPMVVKDHSELNQPKAAYDHFSCGTRGIVVFLKADVDKKDFYNSLKSTSRKTTIEGMTFDSKDKSLPMAIQQPASTPRYGLTERILEKSLVNSGLKGDFEVVDLATINLARSEKSNIMTDGSMTFKITTQIADSTKTVARISYLNEAGKLVPIQYTKTGDKISWTTNFLGVYPYVIEYAVVSTNDNYVSADGDTLTFNTSNPGSVKFVFKGDGADDKSYEAFTGIEIDGNLVAAENYTLTKGSAIITLNDDFVATLSKGSHTIKAFFEGSNKSKSVDFTLQENGSTDPSDPVVPPQPTDPTQPTDPANPTNPDVDNTNNNDDNSAGNEQVSNNVVKTASSANTTTALAYTGDEVQSAFILLSILLAGAALIAIRKIAVR